MSSVIYTRERHLFTNQKTLEEFLNENYKFSKGIWVALSPHFLKYDTILRVILCFGWIDSSVRKSNDPMLTGNLFQDNVSFTKVDSRVRSWRMITPRKTGSLISKRNKDILQSLEQEGLLRDVAIRIIEKAKLDGTWEIVERSKEIRQAVSSALMAANVMEKFSKSMVKSEREQWILRYLTAKRDATRSDMISRLIKKLK